MGKGSTDASNISQSTTNQPIWFPSIPQFFNSPFYQVSNNINPSSPGTGQYTNQLIQIALKNTHIPQHKNNLNHKTKSSPLKNEDHYNMKNKFETDSNSITSTTKIKNKKLRNKTRRSKRKKKGKTDIKIMYSNIRGYCSVNAIL